jgi:ribosome-binding factor A
MESVRQQKVSRLLQKEIGLIFQNQVSHLALGKIVSVTVVRVTPDLSYARVYVSVFPDSDPQKAVDSFNANIKEVTKVLYPRIKNQFRVMPDIRFYYDDSLDYADRINQILPD